MMPLHNPAKGQGMQADTGRAAVPDSVRAVRVNISGSNGRTGEEAREIDVSRLIDLPNVGFGTLNTCGSPPILGTGVAVGITLNQAGENQIELRWSAAVDETMGEQDVVRYAIYRRQAGFVDWGDPYRAIPAGEGAYIFVDDAAASGVAYEYALAAQDCTPSLSELAFSNVVILP